VGENAWEDAVRELAQLDTDLQASQIGQLRNQVTAPRP
jgi:hypothetical protein